MDPAPASPTTPHPVAAVEPIRVLSDEELDAPLDEPDAVPAAAVLPHVAGYELVGLLPRGGQAVVYRARQASTGRLVAVKVLTGGRDATARARRRFDREAQVLAALDHPNLIGVVDAGTAADGAPFLVLPYVDGSPLDEHLMAADLRVVLGVFERLARAVHAAHAAGVVHRDLKPSNVRVDAHGEPRVLDFGLARLLGPPDHTAPAGATLTVDAQLLGSIAWMSPEQAAGAADAADGRADVYALGVMLYEAVAGRPPYPPGPPHATLGHILGTAPPPPSRSPTARRGAGRRVDAVVLRCLAKDPAGRYATAALLADDLARCRGGQRPWAVVDRPLVPTGWWRVVLAGTLAAVAVLLVVLEGLGLGLFSAPRLPPPPGAVRSPTTAALLLRRSDLTGGVSVRVPAGRFVTVDGRTVTVPRPFWLATREATRAQLALSLGRPPPPQAEANLPATDVSVAGARAYCRWATDVVHATVRLPTEAEWEWAARAGADAPADGQRFGTAAGADPFAWSAANAGGRPHPVGTRRANDYRLADMNGNVAEWCDPSGGDPPGNDQPGNDRPGVARGGSYADPPAACTNGARWVIPGGRADPHTGFRVASDDPPSSRRSVD